MKTQRKKNRDQRPVFYSEDYGFLGHLLYSERLLQGISLETVATDLNLSSYLIKDLETGHLNHMPGISYMSGFMRTYASYLGLDGMEMVHCVRIPKPSVFEEERALKVPLQQRQLPSQPIFWGAVCALILIIVGYSSFKPSSQFSPLYSVKLDSSLSPDKPSEELTSSINQFLDIYYKPFAQDIANEPTKPQVFQLCCDSETWIALKDDQGQLVQEGILHKGDQIKLPLDFEGILHTGNAGGVYIVYDNHRSLALGLSGQAIQNFRINLKKILQNH
jgi:cytoskeleton protein RodZ